MIKDLLKKIQWDRIKNFFTDLKKKIPLPKLEKKKISEPKAKKEPAEKKPKFSKAKKISLPKWITNTGKAIHRFFSSKWISRLSIGLCAVALGGVLVLWDLGLIELPFLVRRARRDPLIQSETKEDTSTTTTGRNDTEEDSSSALAVDTIRSLYALAGVNTAKTPITPLPYRADSMTLTKQILPEGSFFASMGFVVKTENGKELLFTASDMQEMLDSEGYHLTHYRASNGDALFTKDGEETYYILAMQASELKRC